jgi:Toprim-like
VTAAATMLPPLPPVWERLDFLVELERREVWVPSWNRRSFVVRCPLPDHQDRTPSCSMTEREGVWLVCCHGCGFSGDGVDLLAALDGMTTSEWLRIRAARAAPLPAPVRRRRPPPAAFRPLCTPAELAGWLDACHRALLDGASSAVARRYARRRGLTPQEVRGWRIGYAIPTRLPKLWMVQRRLVFPCPGGVEGRAIDGVQPRFKPGQKCVTLNVLTDRKLPSALGEVTPAAGPLVIVEGIFDALALHRAEVQAIALRGQSPSSFSQTAGRLAARGFTTAYIGLDAEAKREAVLDVGGALARAGIAPYWARGPQGVKDWGELLTRPVDELVAAVTEGLVLR